MSYIPPHIEPSIDVFMDLKAAFEKELGTPLSENFLAQIFLADSVRRLFGNIQAQSLSDSICMGIRYGQQSGTPSA